MRNAGSSHPQKLPMAPMTLAQTIAAAKARLSKPVTSAIFKPSSWWGMAWFR